MHPSSTPRRRVHIRQAAPRSAVRGAPRIERVLLVSLLAIGLGTPAVKILRSWAQEYEMEQRARHRPAPVRAAAPEEIAVAPVPVAPPSRQGWAADNGAALNFARAGSTPAPVAAAQVSRPWETAFPNPGPVTPAVTVPTQRQAPARTVAAPTREFPFSVLPPAPVESFHAPVATRGVFAAVSAAPLASLVAATDAPTAAIPVAGGNNNLAPIHSVAVDLAPRTRSAVAPTSPAGATQPSVTPGSFTWSGAAAAAGSPADPNWTNGNNWVGNVAPAPTASENISYTPTPVGATATNVNVDYQINSLTFQGPTAGIETPSYNITRSGNSDLSIGVGGILNASANAQTLSLPVYVTANQTWTVSNANGQLNLPVQVYLQGANRVLTVDGAGTTAITGPVNEGSSVTAAQIVKNGTGTLILGNANTYSGGTTLNAGTIDVGDDNALGTGTFTVGPNGGTVSNNAVASGTPFPIGITLPNAVTLNGNLNHGTSNADLTFSGPVNLGTATRTISSSNTNFSYVTFSGAVSATASGAGLTFNNSLNDIFLLTGTAANTYTGTTTVDGTRLYLGKSSAVAVPGDLVIQNNGFVANNAPFGSAGGGQLATRTNLVVNTGGEFDATGGFDASANETVASLNGDSTGTVTFGNQFTQTTLTVGQGNYAGTLRDGSLGDEGRPAATSTPGPAPTTGGALVKNTAGILTLTGNNTYSGGTTITGGRLLVNNVSGSGTGTGPVQISSGTLGGIGRIAGDVTIGSGVGNVGAHLAPGNFVTNLTLSAAAVPALVSPNPNIGTLTVGGSVNFASNGSFDVDFDSNSATADALIVLGSVVINPGALFLGSDFGSTLIAVGTVFTLIDNQGNSLIDGVFANLADKSTVQIGPNSYLVNYEGGTGNDLVFTSASIPEPGTVTLLLAVALGGLGVGGGRLARRRQLSR